LIISKLIIEKRFVPHSGRIAFFTTSLYNMEQLEFLEKNVFQGLKKLTDGFEQEAVPFFSESDFEIVLERAEYFGIAIYGIEPWLNG
jgi:hypothetical protein